MQFGAAGENIRFKKAQTALRVTLKRSTLKKSLTIFFALQLGGMLSICLFFGEFEPKYAYKRYAYK